MKTKGQFSAAMSNAMRGCFGGPVNQAALLRNRDLVVQRAGSLLSYRNYLAQARSFKASGKTTSLQFEQEVQAQATQALSDAHDMAAATLAMTAHAKQAGTLDCVFNSMVTSLKSSGAIQIKDLWNTVATDSSARQLLKEQGVSDELFSAIEQSMGKLDGSISLQGQRIAMTFNAAGQSRTAFLSRSATGAPGSLQELLHRGDFESGVEQFNQFGVDGFALVPSGSGDVDIANLMLLGAVQSVQSVAAHKRKLEDTGLATYTGNDPATLTALIVALVALAVAAIGLALVYYYCPKKRGPGSDNAGCVIGSILLILGVAVALFASGLALGYGPVPPSLLIFLTSPIVQFLSENRVSGAG